MIEDLPSLKRFLMQHDSCHKYKSVVIESVITIID